jgi:hypothetical protein
LKDSKLLEGLSEIKWKTPVFYEQKKWNWGIFLGGCKNHQRVEPKE